VIAEGIALAEEVGLSTARLQRIDDVVEAFIDRGVIAGAVTLVARNGRIAHLAAHGQMDIATGRRMETDSIFRLASMTKPVISAAVLMLFEEGKLLLTDARRRSCRCSRTSVWRRGPSLHWCRPTAKLRSVTC
jgi:CubicO group peptidase (beta-lactamase class C family)